MTKLTKASEKKNLLSKVHCVAEAVAGKKAKDIKALDVFGLTLIADAFVLCTVSSEPQLKAASSAARESMRLAGHSVLRMEGDQRCGWLILDFGDVILHVFRDQARAFYDIDRMWGDAPEISLNLNAN
jgi:ribosome-associated protein